MWRKPDIPGKTTDLPYVTDELYYFMLYRIYLAMNGSRKPNVGGARALIVQVVVNSTAMRSRSRWPPPGFIHYDYVRITYATLGILTGQ